MNHSPRLLLSGLLILFLILSSGAAVTAETTTATTGTGQVSVTGLTMDPMVLMPGDTARVTATIKNSGTTSVSIGNVMIMGVNELYTSGENAYSAVGMLGPGDTMAFTFPVTSTGVTGTFYPTLYLDFLDAGLNSLKYTFPVRVDATQLSVALISQPDAFGQSRNEQVTIRVGNPRQNTLNGIQITVAGEGVSSKQTTYFVGKLDPDQYIDANLTVVVDQPTSLSFEVSYRNGQNLHENSVAIPVELGDRKVKAEIILNNIVISNEGGYYEISGDVNNAGLEDAKSVLITTENATPSAPMKSYVVGSLEPDGLSRFEVTFTNPTGNTVNLLVTYKDADGNPYQTTVPVTLGSNVQAADGESPTADSLPIPLIIAILFGVVLATTPGMLNDRDRQRK